ncbi:MAG: phospholipase D family protein [Nitrospirae bacterium]|nr:phospholipase D family protein [Nitrospirota bacterium]
MQKIKPILIILIIFSIISLVFANDTAKAAQIQVYFSPDGGCTNAIVDEILKSKKEILVQAYSFTSKEISKALIKAKKSGVKVEIILDKSNVDPAATSNLNYSSADFIAHIGIPIYIDDKHSIAHNKIMIIDKETVITGSFNFTWSAEKYNAENLLILKSEEMVDKYINNWNIHRSHSYIYKGR